MSKQLYSFTVEFVYSTNKAVCVSDGISEIWIPKSQIAFPDHKEFEDMLKGDTFTLMIEEWLAEQKGFI